MVHTNIRCKMVNIVCKLNTYDDERCARLISILMINTASTLLLLLASSDLPTLRTTTTYLLGRVYVQGFVPEGLPTGNTRQIRVG